MISWCDADDALKGDALAAVFLLGLAVVVDLDGGLAKGHLSIEYQHTVNVT